MTGPATHMTAGAGAALAGVTAIEALGPHGITAIIFGAAGGVCRWLYIWRVNRGLPDGTSRFEVLVLAALGALFALGMISIAAPFLAVWAEGGTASPWFREVLSRPESKMGISFALGLFASEIIDKAPSWGRDK